MRRPGAMFLMAGVAVCTFVALLFALSAIQVSAAIPNRPALQPSIRVAITKTIGTAPNVCAATDDLSVPPETAVYPCFVITNIGTANLTLTLLVDTHLPLLPPFLLPLDAGEAVTVTDLGGLAGAFVFTSTVSTVTTATIYAAFDATTTVSATDTARVTVLHEYFLPLIPEAPLRLFFMPQR